MADQSSRPVRVSKARKPRSIVAAMNVSPPAVVMAPPRFGLPIPFGAVGDTVPSGTRHAIVPARRSTPTRAPKGGGLHGTGPGANNSDRSMTYGVPRMSV